MEEVNFVPLHISFFVLRTKGQTFELKVKVVGGKTGLMTGKVCSKRSFDNLD